MENQVVLQTFKGTNTATGEVVEWDRDEIMVNGSRVGFVSHFDGAPICLVRLMSDPTIKQIQDEVRKQRAEQNKPPIGDGVSKLPQPEELRKALKQRK